MKKLMFVAAVAAFVGCSTETRGTRVMLDTETGSATVTENSYRLSRRVKVARVTYAEVGGIKKATVTLESLTQTRQRLQARIVWMDAEGTEIDPDGKAFRAIVLDGNDTVTFSGFAPNAAGKTAKVLIREMETVE